MKQQQTNVQQQQQPNKTKTAQFKQAALLKVSNKQ
jgi:hypothetical protein